MWTANGSSVPLTPCDGADTRANVGRRILSGSSTLNIQLLLSMHDLQTAFGQQTDATLDIPYLSSGWKDFDVGKRHVHAIDVR